MELNDEALFKLVLEADEEGLLAGENPKQRSFSVGMKVARKLGITYSTGGQSHPIIARVNRIVGNLYRVEDLAIGSLHTGMFMFRDVFVRVDIPIVLGKFAIDPLQHTNLSDNQLRWLCARPKDLRWFHDQFFDLLDFALGNDDLSKIRPRDDECRKFMHLAHFQLEGAAAIATGAYDFRGAVQSALIGTELVLKSGLAFHGIPEEELRKKYRHDLTALVGALASREPKSDAACLIRTVEKFPEYVKNRYSNDQPSRQEVGNIIMGAQYVASEVVRQLTDRNFRESAGISAPRVYPI